MQCTQAMKDCILADIEDNNRLFLPGRLPTPHELATSFDGEVHMDRLDEEGRLLVLSTLPGDSIGLYLSALDKGLSSAKVFAGRVRFRDGFSKPFVLKLGPADKILDEADRIQRLVSPYIPGVERPIVRRSTSKALVGQSFAGLTMEPPNSFREYIRANEDAHIVLGRFLRERLSNWYASRHGSKRDILLSTAFARHLRKASATPFQAGWTDLQQWVFDATGIAWQDVAPIVADVENRYISSPITIVHGDLHSQNLLVDQRGECWPIDFAWCTEESSPVVDLTMLECSLKFLAIPLRSDLRSLLAFEDVITREPIPTVVLSDIPYRAEHHRVIAGIGELRRFAFEEMAISFADYIRALFLMTFGLSTHPDLNRPYVLGSLQILEQRVTSLS